MLKIQPRSRHRELLAVSALLVGISGGATYALHNQPYYPSVSRGAVAGVSDEAPVQANTPTATSSDTSAMSNTAEAQVQRVLSTWEPSTTSQTSSTSTETPAPSQPTPTQPVDSLPPVTTPVPEQPADDGSGGVLGGVVDTVGDVLVPLVP